MSRCAIYARYSTDLQSDRSIDDQVALCRGFAAKQGLTVGRIYKDRAKSSSSMIGRDGLQDLMLDARAGKFTTLIIEAIDRISRDPEDLSGIYKRLSFAGVSIIAVHEGKADALQIGIRALTGQLFLADLKHKVRRGMTGVVRDGRHAGGRAYGYRAIAGQAGEMEVVEHEANVVRRIFQDYLAGQTPREICAMLNTEGVPAPRGTRWNASTINGNAERNNGILLNPLYAGRIVWNRATMVQDPETGRRVSRMNPKEEWQWADASHLAIVDGDVWTAAQERKVARSQAMASGTSKAPKRPFSGLLRCGVCCGGMSMHDRAGDAIRVRCTTVKESGSCTNRRSYRLDIIERAIFEKLQGQLTNPAYLQEYLRVYREERRAAARETAVDRGKLERELRDIVGQLDRLIDLYARGIVDDAGVDERIAALQKRKAETRERLDAIEAQDMTVELHPHAVALFGKAIGDLAARLKDPDPVFDRELLEVLRKLIASVTISPGEGKTMIIDVMGWLMGLTYYNAPTLGGRVVAEEGFEPPT